MKQYNCRVRLKGDVGIEVPKQNVSEIEIHMLRAIHGPDAVVGIKMLAETNITQEDEIRRLGDIYTDKVVEAALGVKIMRFAQIEESPGEEVEDIPERSIERAEPMAAIAAKDKK